MADELTAALKVARFIDIVEAQVDDHSFYLTAQIDTEQGGINWQWEAQENAGDDRLARHLQTKRWFFPC
jgi:hypothetical protein